jgi:hypothetical protein
VKQRLRQFRQKNAGQRYLAVYSRETEGANGGSLVTPARYRISFLDA